MEPEGGTHEGVGVGVVGAAGDPGRQVAQLRLAAPPAATGENAPQQGRRLGDGGDGAVLEQGGGGPLFGGTDEPPGDAGPGVGPPPMPLLGRDVDGPVGLAGQLDDGLVAPASRTFATAAANRGRCAASSAWKSVMCWMRRSLRARKVAGSSMVVRASSASRR